MRCSVTPEMITGLQPNEVFVFGSNNHGEHGAGAAKAAIAWGAVMGKGFGLHGQTYAIDTMSGLFTIATQIPRLMKEVLHYPRKHFLITPLGCGIAGHMSEEVAPLFDDFLDLPNVSLPQSFIDVLCINERQ